MEELCCEMPRHSISRFIIYLRETSVKKKVMILSPIMSKRSYLASLYHVPHVGWQTEKFVLSCDKKG